MIEGMIGRDPDVVVAEVDGKPLLLNVRTWTYLSFNETGASIWSHLAEPRTGEQVVDALCREFEATKAEVRADVADFLDRLNEQGFLLVDQK